MELEALEELERELGLGDMNLFSTPAADNSSKTPIKDAVTGERTGK
jgi:hypothetical protein